MINAIVTAGTDALTMLGIFCGLILSFWGFYCFFGWVVGFFRQIWLVLMARKLPKTRRADWIYRRDTYGADAVKEDRKW